MVHEELISRLSDELQADSRVAGAWLAGSLGRGEGDRYSDVDIWLAVPDDHRGAFATDWPTISDRISPFVLRQRLDVGSTIIFNHITPQWLRFDVSIGAPAELTERSRSTHRMLFDRDGLGAAMPQHGEPTAPVPHRITALTTEFLRVLGLLPVVLGRNELVVAASGAGLMRGLLIQLMLEDVAVEDRGGALHLARLLPPQRLKLLADLPAIAATRASAVAVHVACAQLFLPLARELCTRTGAAFPEELERALRDHLRHELTIELDE
jgi:hypothetical protein